MKNLTTKQSELGEGRIANCRLSLTRDVYDAVRDVIAAVNQHSPGRYTNSDFVLHMLTEMESEFNQSVYSQHMTMEQWLAKRYEDFKKQT